MTDLTGWTPHAGDGTPEPALKGDEEIIVLLRGGDAGPKESGPALASSFAWTHDDVVKDTAAFLVAAGLADVSKPGGDIIAWCRLSDAGHATRYPHVRADLGR